MVYIQIQWTAESLEEAKKMAKELVLKKWVACANIIPNVESIYLWQNKLCEDKEVKVFFKTSDQFFSKVRDYIIQHASYDIPEISKILVTEANLDYIDWLKETLNNSSASSSAENI